MVFYAQSTIMVILGQTAVLGTLVLTWAPYKNSFLLALAITGTTSYDLQEMLKLTALKILASLQRGLKDGEIMPMVTWLNQAVVLFCG